jgi:hypothetical protein
MSLVDANRPDPLDAIKTLWGTYGNLRTFHDLVRYGLPQNPWIAYSMVSRPDTSICVTQGLNDRECEDRVNRPRRMGDEAAAFGGKAEMLVFVVAFVLYPVYCNWNRGRAPSTAQVLIHAAAAAAWTAVTLVRGQFVFEHASAHLQHCVDLASAVLFGLLAIAMWCALPVPDNNMPKALNRVREIQEIQNDEVRHNSERIARLEETTVNHNRLLEDVLAILRRMASSADERAKE